MMQQNAAVVEPSDDFVRAVMVAFDPSLPSSIQSAANTQLETMRSSADGWRFCLHQLHSLAIARGPDQVKFWCLNVINELMDRRFANMIEDDKSVVRRSLMLYVRDVIPLAPQSRFVKNKLCTIFVKIVKHDYPERWPSFFADFISLLDRGPETVDIFVRILKILDEDVVEEVTDPRLGGGSHGAGSVAHKTATFIKDSMRERDLSAIVDAIYTICSMYAQSNTALVASAVGALATYIEWIDIKLVVNPRFLQLLYAFMDGDIVKAAAANGPTQLTSSPSRPSNPNEKNSPLLQLQTNATDCITEMLHKRMDGAKKLSLINEIQIVGFLQTAFLPKQASLLFPSPQSADATQPPSPNRSDVELFAEAVANLVCAVGEDVIDAFDRLEKQVAKSSPSPSSNMLTPLSSSPPTSSSPLTASQSAAMVADALPILNNALSLGFRFLEHPSCSVASSVLDLNMAYVALVKRQGPWSSSAPAHFRAMFASLAKAMEFPPWYRFTANEDEESLFCRFRAECNKLFRNMAQISPQLLLELTSERIQFILLHIDTTPALTIEVTLRLFFEIAVPLRGNLNAAQEPYRSLLASLLQSKISHHAHPQVSLVYFDTMHRYARFFDSNPQFIGPLLTSLLDRRGVSNPNATVRGRAAYLLLQILKGFNEGVKKNLQPFLDDMLRQIQNVIETVLGSSVPPPSSSSSSQSLSGGGHHRRLSSSASMSQASDSLLAFEDMLYLCETMGCLVSSAVTGADGVRNYVAIAVSGFQKQLEAIIAHVASLQSTNGAQTNGTTTTTSWSSLVDEDRIAFRVAQLIECVSALSKALTNDGVRIHDVMLGLFRVILQAFTHFQAHNAVIKKTIFFTHRIVECHPHITQSQVSALQQSAGAAVQSTSNPEAAAVAAAAVNAADGPLVQCLGIEIPLLLRHATTTSIPSIIELINQCILKLKRKFAPVLDQQLLSICRKIFELIATYSHIDLATSTGTTVPNGITPVVPLPAAAYSSERSERLDIQRGFFNLMKSIVISDLPQIFMTPTNAPHIANVLQTVLGGFVAPQDFSVHRNCFFVMQKLISQWTSDGTIERDAQLRQFVYVDVTTQAFKTIVSPHFDLNDPNAIAAVRELLDLLRTMVKTLGDGYRNFLLTDFLTQRLQLPPNVALEFYNAIGNYTTAQQSGSEWKQFEQFFRTLQSRSHPSTPNNLQQSVAVR